MANSYSQIPIQLQLSTASAPPVAPVDANTGLAPSFWRGQPIALNIGIFDPSNNPVNLSNLSGLQVAIWAGQSSLYPLAVVNIPSTDPNWNNLITTQQWKSATLQNAIASLSPAMTDQSLGGLGSCSYWMTITGTVAANGAVITYGAGAITIINPGTQVGLLTAPAPTENALTNGGGNSTITPSSLIHTTVLTITGTAGTRDAILSTAGYSSLFKGAQLDVLLKLPATPGIVIDFFDTSSAGANVADYTTDGTTLSQCVRFFFDGTQWQYKSSSP